MAVKKQHFSSLGSPTDSMYSMTDEDIKRLHQVLLDMYKEINEVCRKHKIHLIAAGGTALGTIRHKGFIPWDDDMDLFMFRSEFEKFREFFYEELGERYYLLAPGNKDGANCFLPRIMKKGTTLLGMIDEAAPYPHGIYIDINIIEYAPQNKVMFGIKSLMCDSLRFISYSVYWSQYKSRSFADFMLHSKGNKYYRFRMLIGKVFGFRKAEDWFALFDKCVKHRRSDVFTVPSGTKKYRGEVLKKNVVLPLKKVIFEDTSIFVFNDYDWYLSNLYGDYMVIPDQQNRERHLCLKLDFDSES